MSDNTPRLGIAELAQMQEMDAATINEAFVRLDAISDVYLLGQYVNTPPASPADGDTYVTGDAPTDAWSGYAYKIAYCIDGGWRFFTPFNGLRAFVEPTNGFIAYRDGAWIDSNALISASEVSIASASTCDLGAAGSLFVQVTGATAITGLGSGANLLRLVRFAGALTLTHNATSLVLPGGGNIATIAGDCAVFTSDGSGNWRCRSYQRATALGRAGDIMAAGPAGTALSGTGLGIGRAATTYPLEVKGANGQGIWYSDGTITLGAFGYNGNTLIGSISNHPVQVTVNNAAVAQFSTDGSFLVGTTTNGGWTGGAKAALQAAGGTALTVHQTVGSSNGLSVRADNTACNPVLYYYGTALVGSTTFTGGGTGVAYNTSSDARLKDRLESQRDFGAIIDALWFGDVAFKSDESRTPYLLCIAQEAAAHFPDAIHVPTDPDAMWSADYGKFAPLALWGVKELRGRIAALEARVAALESSRP